MKMRILYCRLDQCLGGRLLHDEYDEFLLSEKGEALFTKYFPKYLKSLNFSFDHGATRSKSKEQKSFRKIILQ